MKPDHDCQICSFETRISFMYGLILGSGLTGGLVVFSIFAQKWIFG